MYQKYRTYSVVNRVFVRGQYASAWSAWKELASGTVGSNILFEGATEDNFEITLAITDPTADRTITFPDATTTVVGTNVAQTLTNKTITSLILTAGTATAGTAPLYFSDGVNLTVPTYGAMEADTDQIFITNNPGPTANGAGRGLISAPHIVFSLADATASTNVTRSVFAAANDVLSVLEPAKLYRFRAKYYSSFTHSGIAGAIQTLFTFSNAPVAIKYTFRTYPQTAGTTVTQQGVSTVATATTVVPSQAASGTWVTEIEGYFTTHATLTSTLTPQFLCTAGSSSTGTVQTGSWFEVEKLGTSSQTLISGNWA